MNNMKNDILFDIVKSGNLHFQQANQDEILVTIPHNLSNKKELHITIKAAKGGWNVHIFERTDDLDFDLIFDFVSKDELNDKNAYLVIIFDELSKKIECKLKSFLIK